MRSSGIALDRTRYPVFHAQCCSSCFQFRSDSCSRRQLVVRVVELLLQLLVCSHLSEWLLACSCRSKPVLLLAVTAFCHVVKRFLMFTSPHKDNVFLCEITERRCSGRKVWCVAGLSSSPYQGNSAVPGHLSAVSCQQLLRSYQDQVPTLLTRGSFWRT